MQKKATAVSRKVERGWGKVLETGNHCLIHDFMFSGLHAERDTGGKSVPWIKQDYLFKKIKEASSPNPSIVLQINDLTNYLMDTTYQHRYYNEWAWISWKSIQLPLVIHIVIHVPEIHESRFMFLFCFFVLYELLHSLWKKVDKKNDKLWNQIKFWATARRKI